MTGIHTKKRRTVPLSAFILYFVITLPLIDNYGSALTMMLIIPVAVAGASLGSKWGTIGGFIGVGYNLLVLYLLLDFTLSWVYPFMVGSALIVFVGFLAGKMRDLNDRLEDEIVKRENAEKSLSDKKERIKDLHELTKNLQKVKSMSEVYDTTFGILTNITYGATTYVDIIEDGKSVVEKYDLDFKSRVKNKKIGKNSMNSIPISSNIQIRIALDSDEGYEDEYLDLIRLLGSHLIEALNRLKVEERVDFLHSMLRHDLKNKIQISRGYLQLIEEGDIPVEYEGYLSKAIESYEQGLDIIEKVRKQKKIDKTEIRNVQLDSMIRDVINQCESEGKKNGVEIKSVKGDPLGLVKGGELLEEAFTNIISNSILHSGGSKIIFYSRVNHDDVICTIEDDGKGISDENKDRVFKQGYRHGENAGTGLGTYLAKQIIEDYGGKVEVKDSKLGGARFDIYLKRVQEA